MQVQAQGTSQAEQGSRGTSFFFEGDYQRIYRYILSMVHGEQDAEDLTQETFLRAHLQRDSLRDETAQVAWLYRIATHAALDRLRQYGRRDPVHDAGGADA